jgi:hypothetical protein
MKGLVAAGLAVAALAVTAPAPARAQNADLAKNAFYVELGGSGVIYSINYERMFGDMSMRAGFSYLSVSSSATAGGATGSAKVSATGIPVTMSYLGIGGNNKLELGGGVLFEKFSGQASWGIGQDVRAGAFVPMATFILGYRYQPAHGGFNFRLAFTPVYHPDVGFYPWGGLSFGVGF